jgi:hypothetical protein
MNFSPALQKAGGHSGQSTLDLHISDPASLLNEVARRYLSTERILMEYVDNALDDAEHLYRNHGEAYPFEVRVEIVVDSRRRFVTVRDNCRGMRREVLERVVTHIGESQKRGLPWVNGRFGFGVHAFRAAAETIRFRTRHATSSHLELTLRRDQHRDIRRAGASFDAFPTTTGTGTEITVGPFDEEWFENVSAETIKQEVERHFERLLARPNLSITVQEDGEAPLRCEPFDYSRLPGEEFRRTLDIEHEGHIHTVEAHLKVAAVEVPLRAARFFSRGRRINEVAEIKSFIRKSGQRTSVWGHPHLLGYIEVGDIVKPGITRDDFDRGRGRTALYAAILELEEEIKDALNRINEAQRDTSLHRLEDALRDVLDDLAREDKLRLRSEMAAGNERGTSVAGGGAEGGEEGGPQFDQSESEGEPNGDGEGRDAGPKPETPGLLNGQSEGGQQIADDLTQQQGSERKRSGFDIRFGNYAADINGMLKRSMLVDGAIHINIAHPDFKERITCTRQGRPRFNDRLGAYLAATVSIHYKDQFYLRYGRQPERRDQMFDEQVEFQCRLEAALRPHLATLQQDFIGEIGEEVSDE